MPNQRNLLTLIAITLVVACAQPPAPPDRAPVIGPDNTATVVDSIVAIAEATSPATPAIPLPTARVLTAYRGPLSLAAASSPVDSCEQPSPLDLPRQGVTPLAFVPTGVCSNGEIGLLEIGARLYAVQIGLFSAAFTITDVTEPTAPKFRGAWQWRPHAITYDVKPFRQHDRWYLALAMENQRQGLVGPCGIAIVEVTNPERPTLLGRYDGANTGADVAWCNVHTTQIDTGPSGDGAFLLASSRDTFDLRALDIRDLSKVREVNHYHLHDHPHYGPPDYAGSFVHDTTIVGDRVYVAYWGGGVVILDRQAFASGAAVSPIGHVKLPGFNVHHSYPIAGGSFLFVEAEDRLQDALRLVDIRDPARPREVLAINLDHQDYTPHNLLVHDNLLFVGWYGDGVRVFQYDIGDAERPVVQPVAYQVVRAEPGGDPFDGIWGMRVHACQVDGRAKTCLYGSDMRLGLLVLGLEE
jgi:hypothetical protein